MKKRILPFMLVLILSFSLWLTAGAVSYIPDDVTYQNLNGQQFAIKTYTLLPDQNPAELIEDDFDYAGYRYAYADIVKEELTFSTQHQQKEIITVETETKALEDILAMLEPTINFDDGVSQGVLTLDHNSLSTEVAGYTSGSYTVTATRNYTGLDRNDSSYIDKTVDKDGRTLSLSNVVWSVESTTLVGDELIAASYSAVATYSGTAYYNQATGYITTAEYNGIVTSSGISGIRYTVTYVGTLIEPEATPAPDVVRDLVEEPENPSSLSPIPFIILGAVIIAAGLLLFLFLFRKNTTVYSGNDSGFEMIGRLRLDPKKPEINIDQLKQAQGSMIAVEITGAIARRLFGSSVIVHNHGRTLKHTVGETNSASYWFKLNVSDAADDYEEVSEE